MIVDTFTNPAKPSVRAEFCEAQILDFFSVGYGESHLGQDYFLDAYIYRADRIVVLGGSMAIKAAGLIRKGRITAAATHPDCERYGSRRDRMRDLLVSTHALEPNGWLTIKEQAKGMRTAAFNAGMLTLEDEADVHEKLLRFGENESHTVTKTKLGLAVTRIGSAHGSDYIQHAWGW
jgi:hypothetical protein